MEFISLIGMPASGKTVIGSILSSNYGFEFVDTDELFQKEIGLKAAEYIILNGESKFLEIQENIIIKLISNLSKNKLICISTGGSVVYSEILMNLLKEKTVIFWLKKSLDKTIEDIKNYRNNAIGIVKNGKNNIEEVFKQRNLLYKKYCDYEIDVSDKNWQINVEQIINLMKEKISDKK